MKHLEPTHKQCSRCKQVYPIEEFREYRYECRLCRNIFHKEYRQKNPEKVPAYHLREIYGLTLEEYDQILEDQGGGCLICGRTSETENITRKLPIDHDEKDGHIRGILCTRCNTALGMFHHDKELMRTAIRYLILAEKYRPSLPGQITEAGTRMLIARKQRRTSKQS